MGRIPLAMAMTAFLAAGALALPPGAPAAGPIASRGTILGLRDGRVRVLDAGHAVAAGGAVRYVEPNYVYRASAAGDDPLLGQQWALDPAGVFGAPAAWTRTTGQGVVVALLDTGVDLHHPDLQGALWTNPGEIPDNGRDDDGDGIVDDVHGANIVTGTGDPSDDEGHGTHVAGIVAARAGNGIGGSGIAPGATIMPVKVLDAQRAGTAAGLAVGIRYAVAHGARIINASVNGDGESQALQDAIADARGAGAVVVCSAGNDGRDIDARPSYPASYPDASIVAAGAATPDAALASFSNRGARSVDLAAPGTDVLSTALQGEGYELRSGTSMASPFVAGALALLASARPDLPMATLRQALLSSARPEPALAGAVATGELDVAAALGSLGMPVSAPQPPAVPDAAVAPPPEPAPTAKRFASASRRRLALSARASRARGGAILRWSARGDTAAVRRFRVTVNGRPVAFVSRAARRGRNSHTLRVRARRGAIRWRIAAQDARGSTLAAAAGRFLAPRVHAARHR